MSNRSRNRAIPFLVVIALLSSACTYVETVEWVGVVGNDGLTNLSDDNPASHGGGHRIYPGKNFELGLLHNRVTARATLNQPADEEITVYFRIFDVDDPTQNGADNPVDSNDTATARTGGDNRPSGAGISPSGIVVTTIPVGGTTAEVTYTITDRQPGNNWRVVANQDLTYTTNTSLDESVEGEGLEILAWDDEPVPPKNVSPLLSVWRRLTIEQDSMAAPGPNDTVFNSTNAIDSVTATVVSGVTLYKVDLGVNLPDSFSDVDLFEEGTIRFAACPAGSDTFTIYSNTSNTVFDDEILITANPPACALTGFYTLRDDDQPTAAGFALPRYPSAGAIGDAAYAQAYITLDYAETSYRDVVAFDLNQNSFETVYGSWTDGRDLITQTDYWVHLAVGAYQAGQNHDFDPDGFRALPPINNPTSEAPDYGLTPSNAVVLGADEVSAIFMETIRESATVDEAHVVTHEVAHGVGDNALHDHGGIMGEPGEDFFAPDTIAVMRSVERWGDP